MTRPFLSLLLLAALAGCAPSSTPEGLRFSTAHDSEAERRTVRALEGLLERHDLTRWRYTDAVRIDEDAIPHSHPVLTLHTRHLGDDDMLLATYVHEQIHWQLEAQPERLERALAVLRPRYPEPPVGFPEGARDVESSHLHLVVCRLELDAMIALLGESEARTLLGRQDHYTWIYERVLEDDAIGEAVRAAGL